MTVIAFCTTCKNRTDHLKQTLPQNLRDNPNSKFIVLNYGSEDDLLEYILRNHWGEISDDRLVVYGYRLETGNTRFRMAHAKNMAHRCGIREGAGILVNLDADNLTRPKFEGYIAREMGNAPEAFLWANVLQGRVQGTDTLVPRGVSGRIVVSDDAFVKTGGYDEAKFNHWGSDDKDFNIRLRDLGYYGIEIPADYLSAIPHSDKRRFKEYPHVASYADEIFTVNRSTVTKPTVNGGRFGCGVVYRNGDFGTPIELQSSTPRYFGIGMHKTGTTSLHHAMQALGYKSWHWSSAHAAKTIWQEMNNLGHSPMLEKFDALCDLPIPMLYRKLDVAYPGSKFILTIRNQEAWLSAVEKHFDSAYNKWRSGWDSDPFTNRVHQILYKRTEFELEVMLSRYEHHNAEVMEYFKDRPEDLLVMNIDNGGAGWPTLCGFLGCPVPKTPYPHQNHTPRERPYNV